MIIRPFRYQKNLGPHGRRFMVNFSGSLTSLAGIGRIYI